jgi:hypothetical protein
MPESNKFNIEEVSEEQLMNYLSGNLSDDELKLFEQQIEGSDFIKDAVEGLKNLPADKKLHEYVRNLNKNLHQQLSSRKIRKEASPTKYLYWIIFSVITILVLCIIAYVLVIKSTS